MSPEAELQRLRDENCLLAKLLAQALERERCQRGVNETLLKVIEDLKRARRDAGE